MWFLTVLIILVITVLRLVLDQLDPAGAEYEEGRDKETTI
jgi:hypothetical protein